MKKIITIAREFGAGGNEIGRRIAGELGIEYYDKDMVMRTALMDPKLDNRAVAYWESQMPSRLKLFQGLYDFYTKPMDDQILRAQKDAILQMANKESCVIVGRNSNYILKEFDHALHVFVHADKAWRLNRLTGLMPDVPRENIILEMKDVDKARRKSYAYVCGGDYGDARDYDLCLDTSKLGIDACVALILQAAEHI